jgi:hypothetical protein
MGLECLHTEHASLDFGFMLPSQLLLLVDQYLFLALE